jgi:hypothetical protein
MDNSTYGFFFGGNHLEFADNQVVNNGSVGFLGLTGTGNRFRRNVVTQNGTGLALGGEEFRVLGNDIRDNVRSGILLTGGQGTIHRNNIVGNAEDFGFGDNCGLTNQSGTVIDAKRNFWGAATGPGPNPADNAGPNSGCDAAGSSTDVLPFATEAFPSPGS